MQNQNEMALTDVALENAEALAEETIKGCCPSGGACIISGMTLLNVYPCSV
jgi:hypothetical protein